VEPDQAAPGRGRDLSGEPLVALPGAVGDQLLLSADLEEGSTWILRRGSDAVGVAGTAPPKIEAAGETWTGAIRRGGRGWWAEFTRDGTSERLSYRPRLLSGGDLELGQVRYRLRSRVVGGRRLLDGSGEEIARLEAIGGSMEKAKLELRSAAPQQARLATLLLASCLAMIWDAMTPHVGAGGNGGA
jgi:hypothetical protein